MNHLSDVICITCCGSASTQTIIPSSCGGKKKKGKKLDTREKQLTAFTRKQKVKHIPTCLHKQLRTSTDKYIDARAASSLYQKQTRAVCTHWILLPGFYLSDRLSQPNERAGGSIKMQGWWMKEVNDRREKGRGEEGGRDKREGQGSNSLLKLSQNLIIGWRSLVQTEWWVGGFALFFLTYFLPNRDNGSPRKYITEAIWPPLAWPHTHAHTHVHMHKHCVSQVPMTTDDHIITAQTVCSAPYRLLFALNTIHLNHT